MNTEYWERELYMILNALGSYPTPAQTRWLEHWVKANVPAAHWGAIAWHLPTNDLKTDFRMYAAENGDY